LANTGSNRVLFISHEASRSGAPIVLLNLLRWIKANTNLQFDILLLNDGPLKAGFEAVAKTYIAGDIFNQHSTVNRFKKKLFKSTPNKIKKVTDRLSNNKYQLIYGNTILSLPWLNEFKQQNKVKTICCIHELSFALNHCFDKTYLTQNLPLIDQIIAVSQAVKNNLIDNYQLNTGKIELQYEFIDTDITINTDAAQPIGSDEFMIGAGGTPEWRKGTDLIIPLALKLIEQYPDLKFKIAWLGADTGTDFIKSIIYDAEKCGIRSKLLFIKPSNNPLEIINQFDVFVLLSREDPFPLIALEAAFLQKPIIAFENSGGIPELLNQGAGLLTPYLDLTKMADCLYRVYGDGVLRKQIGVKGKELILEKYNSGVIPPNIYTIINKLIS
jgi:glycosyltransferase involved in cell wall biosynthesis